jgi:hypothetical protein
MKRVHGIVCADDGAYVMVSLRKDGMSWRMAAQKRWNSDNKVRTHLLLSKGIHLGVAAQWVPASSLHAESDEYATAESDILTACADKAVLDQHYNALRHNILGAVPDDIFLASIPLQCIENPEDSFIAVYRGERCWKIGVVIDNVLQGVYRCAPADQSMLEGHIQRISHYMRGISEMSLPTTVYLLNDRDITLSGKWKTCPVEIPFFSDTLFSEPQVQAAGVALIEEGDSQPFFGGISPDATHRHVRLSLLYAALFLPLCTIAATLGIWGYTNSLNSDIEKYKSEYRNILAHNKEVNTMLNESKQRAVKVLRMKQSLLQRTNWTEIVQHLGVLRPEKLFFERLGCEKTDRDSHVRVALQGWGYDETLVTEFISRLQEYNRITHVSLSSMERDPRKKNLTRFKLICTVQLTDS